MNQRTLLGRLLSPAGFGLVLIFFLLPFATVSCGNSAEQVQATFSGLDLAIGGLPEVTTPDSDPASAEQVAQLVVQVSDLEPLALLAALAVLAGMAVAALPRVRIRHGAAVALAAIAAGLMVAAIARAPGRVNEFLRQLAGAEELPAGAISSTSTRYGFWLAVFTLAGLVVGNGLALLRARRCTGPDPKPAENLGPEPDRLRLEDLAGPAE